MLTNQLQFPNDPGLDTQTTFDVNSSNNRLNSYTIDHSPVSTLYDPAGNMISEGSQTYTYDDAGRMVAVGVDAAASRLKEFIAMTLLAGVSRRPTIIRISLALFQFVCRLQD